ncbi:MAG: indole-3-glycerol phosphate synthase TrpC [Maricaulaceae bacterium]
MTSLMDAPDVLKKIAAYKVDEVAALRSRITEAELLAQAKAAPKPLGFEDALIDAARTRPALITEIKKASPSKGLIRADFNSVEIAQSYARGGAACLSVLTDGPGFQGSNEIFQSVRAVSPLPMLRKDFMIDPVQIIECRAMGADCILIIMAMIDDALAKDLFDTATDLGMDALIETHTPDEVRRGLKLGGTLMGINNRDLRTFDTSLDNFSRLTTHIPDSHTLIAESGVFTRADIERLTGEGAHGFLIGESLMRQADVEGATRALI